ncbi:MAG TPA: hypothetical protein VNV37_00800 [Solirubrobacteraceae bacterium]|nr:hypothetical protein [Solirubrobacteraceae bacterium]
MPPVERVVPRFAAEPPQEGLPYGRWAQRLERELLAAWAELGDVPRDAGEPGEIVWYPDRGWHGRTYVPATATAGEYELYGYVRYVPPGEEGGEPRELTALVDFTDQTAAANPQWSLDLCDEVVGRWRGGDGETAAMTLVWGRPLVPGGAVVTAELDRDTVDQCELLESRFTLIAPDDYRGRLLEIKLWDRKGGQLAGESLYEGDEEETP